MKLKISIPIGDAFDKLSILEIKQLHAEDAKQISNILNEVDSLSSELESLWEGGGERLASIYKKLKATNLELWGIEDSIRLKEKDRLFDEEFIQLAITQMIDDAVRRMKLMTYVVVISMKRKYIKVMNNIV